MAVAMAVVMLVGRHTSEARDPFTSSHSPEVGGPRPSRVLGSKSNSQE